jgi:hypothetical protein
MQTSSHPIHNFRFNVSNIGRADKLPEGLELSVEVLGKTKDIELYLVAKNGGVSTDQASRDGYHRVIQNLPGRFSPACRKYRYTTSILGLTKTRKI